MRSQCRVNMEKVVPPAEKFAAAKKRSKHPLTQEFIDSFDFAFDDLVAWKAGEGTDN